MTFSRTKHPTLLIGPISVLEMQRPSSKQKTNDDFFFFLGQLRYRSVIYHLDRCRYAVTGLDSFLRGRGGWIKAEYYSVATEIRNNEVKRKKKKRSISSLSGRGNKLRLSRISFHGRDGRDLVLFGSSQEISKTFAKISPLFPL